MSQTVTMLRALREAGPEGVHTFVFRRQHFIANPSQRFLELEEMGHVISSEPEKLHGNAIGRRYTLTHDAGGSGDRNEWLIQQARGDEPPAATAVHSAPDAEPELIEGALGLCLFASPSDTTRDQYRDEAA